MRPILRSVQAANRAFLMQRRNYHAADHVLLLGGNATRAMALNLARRQHTDSRGPEHVVCISSNSWVQNIHPDWYHLKWGQNARYLPKEMHEVFKQRFPYYSESELLTFEQMQQTSLDLESLLKKSGVKLINQDIKSLHQEKSGLYLETEKGHRQLVCPNTNFFIFNSAKTNLPSLLKNISLNPFSNVYSFSKENLLQRGPIALIGSGLNTTWAFRDLENPLIYLIPKGERIQREFVANPKCLFAIDMSAPNFKYHLKENDLVEITGFDLKTNKEISFMLDINNFFNARGTTLDKSIVKVDPARVTHVDTAAKPEDLKAGFSLWRGQGGSHHIRPSDMRGTSVPPGNLAHVYYALKSNFNKIASYPIDSPKAALMNFSAWKSEVVHHFRTYKINIDPHFFPALYEAFKHAAEQHVPSENHLKILMKRIYSNYPNTKLEKSGTKTLSWEEFNKILHLPPLVDPSMDPAPGVTVEPPSTENKTSFKPK